MLIDFLLNITPIAKPRIDLIDRHKICTFRKSDSGDYICQVESPLGTDLWSAHLKVEGKRVIFSTK